MQNKKFFNKFAGVTRSLLLAFASYHNPIILLLPIAIKDNTCFFFNNADTNGNYTYTYLPVLLN